jgi:hypothetical protein
MLSRTVGTILLCLMTLSLVAVAGEPAPSSTKAGYALIDLYITAFKNMALIGTNKTLDADLDKMMAEAKKARTAGDIDAVFMSRYTRLLAMTKLLTMKDPEKMISPVLNAERSRYVMEILGEEPKPEGPGALGQMANTLAFAIVDLQIYLDTRDSRQERYDRFVKNFDPGK